MSTVIKASDYLTGLVPNAAFCLTLNDPSEISNYTVEGAGTLFTVGNDLYITNAALAGVVSPDSTLSVIFEGNVLPVYATLPEGVAAQDVLLVVGSTYSANASFDVSGKTIIGTIKSGSLITGASNVRQLSPASAGMTIAGLTFRDNYYSNSNGSVVNSNYDWSGEDLIFDHNVSGNTQTNIYGGAILVKSNTVVTLNRVVFSGNTAAGRGGAAYVNAGGTLTLSNATVTGNATNNSNDNSVGGIFTEGTLRVSDSVFSDNGNSANRGGALRTNSSGTMTVDKTLFTRNTGTYGAALCNYQSKNGVTVTGSTFAGNIATSNTGSAIGNMNGVMTIGASADGTWCYFLDNVGGQAIRNHGSTTSPSTMTIGNAYFSGNSVAIYNDSGCTLNINGQLVLATALDRITAGSNSVINVSCSDFLSDDVRAALVIATPSGNMTLPALTLTNTDVGYDVISSRNSQGFYIMQEGLTLDTPIVSNWGNICRSVIGGTVYYGEAYNTLSAAIAADSTVILDGYTHSSGLFNPNTSATILGTDGATFVGSLNRAISVNSGITVDVSGVTFRGNSGGNGGAVNIAGTFIGRDLAFVDNLSGTTQANVYGGAISVENGSTVTLDRVLFSGNTCSGNGGAI